MVSRDLSTMLSQRSDVVVDVVENGDTQASELHDVHLYDRNVAVTVVDVVC